MKILENYFPLEDDDAEIADDGVEGSADRMAVVILNDNNY